MKKAFKKSFFFSWKTLMIFTALASLWHLPLFWVKDQAITAKHSIRTLREERQLIYHREVKASFEETLNYNDPTLYLLPSKWSFSTYRNRKLTPPIFSGEQLTPPQVIQEFQPISSGELSTSEALSLASSSLTQTSENNSKLTFDHSEKGASWRIVGEPLSSRAITPSSSFPKIKFDVMPQMMTVRLGVSPLGEVLFVLIDKSSGNDSADDLAVHFAKTLKFSPKEPVESEAISWGSLKIDWRQNSNVVLSDAP